MPKHTTQDESSHSAKQWVFTLNNYTDMDIARLKVYAEEKCAYMIFSKEEGNSGTPHLQGFLQLKLKSKGQTVKNQSKVLKMWMGIANGSATKNFDYCTKQYMKKDDQPEVKSAILDEAVDAGDIFIFGKPVDVAKAKAKGSAKGGAATQAVWSKLKDYINAGREEREIMNDFPQLYFKHHRGVQRGIEIANQVARRKEKTCVHIYIGPPGCGKTTAALKEAGEDAYWYNSPNKIWWSGYSGTENVVLDDFHGNYPFDEFKKLTDAYPHKVPVHGALQNFNSKLIVITSNKLPTEWWKPEVLGTHGMAALFRRIHVYFFWDPIKRDFVQMKETSHDLWKDGCLCRTRLERAPTVPIIEIDSESPEELASQEQQLDLSNSQFVDIPVPPKKRVAPGKPIPAKRLKLPSAPSKKQKLFQSSESDTDDPDVPFEEVVEDDDDDSIEEFSDSDNGDVMDAQSLDISEDLEN